MIDQTQSATPSGSNDVPKPKRRWFLLTAGALAAALTGAVATTALSEGGPPWMRGGMMGGPFHMGGPFSPAAAEDRADRMIRHLAIEIDATPEQLDKLRSISKTTVRDLLPLRDKAQSARERARDLLTQSTLDRAAIEAFRREQMALADEASRRIANALADASEVLTPEQRRKIDEHVQWRRNRWHNWRRG
jgi:Spy/CpxP family protein refolding chaperone